MFSTGSESFFSCSVKKASKADMDDKDSAEQFLASVSAQFVMDVPMYNKTKVSILMEHILLHNHFLVERVNNNHDCSTQPRTKHRCR